MIDPAIKDCLERIAMIAEATLNEANKAIESGDVDQWTFDTFKQCKYVKNYVKWIKNIQRVNATCNNDTDNAD